MAPRIAAATLAGGSTVTDLCVVAGLNAEPFGAAASGEQAGAVLPLSNRFLLPSQVGERETPKDAAQRELVLGLDVAGATVARVLDRMGQFTDAVPPYAGKFFKAADPEITADLKQRGLFDSTLIVWMGEFGRTASINNNGGRDHYSELTPLLLAGGGLKMGQIIGQSDRTASQPAANDGNETEADRRDDDREDGGLARHVTSITGGRKPRR